MGDKCCEPKKENPGKEEKKCEEKKEKKSCCK